MVVKYIGLLKTDVKVKYYVIFYRTYRDLEFKGVKKKPCVLTNILHG